MFVSKNNSHDYFALGEHRNEDIPQYLQMMLLHVVAWAAAPFSLT
jgi:hypothetical protein